MKVAREALLSVLDLVSPGVTTREAFDQSDCFAFTKEGNVVTFNDEVACIQKSPIKLRGAIHGNTLRNLLQKMDDETVDVVANNGNLSIVGKRKQATIRMERKILLPLQHLDVPKKWHPLPDNFGDAVQFVKECAGKDESKPALVCVHITPELVEAFDNDQYACFFTKIKSLKHDVLIRATALEHVTDLAANEYSLTDSWMHFRNSGGLIFSCRRQNKKYRDTSNLRKQKGERIKLPDTLAKSMKRAEVFSINGPDDNQVLIELSKKKVVVTGTGAHGKYVETRKIAYMGAPLQFMITPTMFDRLLKQQQYDCEVMPTALKVEGTSTMFLTSLNTPADANRKRQSKNEVNGEDE